MTKQRNTYILVINCGSSSLKFSLYGAASLLPQWSGSISHIGSGHGKLEIKTNQLQVLESRSSKFKNLENSDVIRERICKDMEFMGIDIAAAIAA